MVTFPRILFCNAWLGLWLAAWPGAAWPGAAAAGSAADAVETGRRIYREGVLAGGDRLTATRAGGGRVSGPAAACIQCHRRSGFGQSEASVVVPPVTGPALFENKRLDEVKPRRSRMVTFEDHGHRTRPPYDAAALVRAIREGVSAAGKPLHPLMPRYEIGDADAGALVAFLRSLSSTPSPGLDGEGLHFATVVAPGQPPARREGMLGVLQACFADYHPPGKQITPWRLHVWELSGAQATWKAQLEERLASRPVFALVSGLGGGAWKPVHDFCESERLPCLFPNVDVPGSTTESDYNFYFSRGVLLEADVAAEVFRRQHGSAGLRRLVQIVSADQAGIAAAELMRSRIAAAYPLVEQVTIKLDAAAAWQRQLEQVRAGDALALWLRGDALRDLAGSSPPPASLILASGSLGGGERTPLPRPWRAVVHMIYPIDAPPRREVRMSRNLRPWLTDKGIVGDEALLGNTLAACNLLNETMGRARGAMHRDFLVDLLESYPSGMGNAPAPQAYPRFSLGPGQRYSSKGAYVVRFAGDQLDRVEPVYDWIVP